MMCVTLATTAPGLDLAGSLLTVKLGVTEIFALISVTQALTTYKSAGRKQVTTTPPGAIASPNLVVNYPQISPHKGLKQNPSGLVKAPAKSSL